MADPQVTAGFNIPLYLVSSKAYMHYFIFFIKIAYTYCFRLATLALLHPS